MKIMLISSMVTHATRASSEWTAEYDTGDFPPIGLMYLAGYLRKNSPHHDIQIVDANVLRYNQDDIKREVLAFNPDVVGITILSDILFDCLEIIKTVKNISSNIKVVAGGAFPTKRVDETMGYFGIDYICVGEGEVVFNKLIDALEGKCDIASVDCIVYRDADGNVLKNGGKGYADDLDLLPHPAFDLLDFEKYYSMIGTGKPTAVLCSSRGCPYNCTFCSKLYSNYRGRSADNIVEEMKLYYDKGIREFLFFDDMFNVNVKRAIGIAKKIKETFTKKDIEWSFRGRADQVTQELAIVLRESGCAYVTLGAEAHKNEILDDLKTGKKVEYVRNAVNIFKKNKIKVNTNWIVGLPHHKTKKDIEDMLDLILQIDSDYVQLAILVLWEGTELYDQAVERKIVDPKEWAGFIKNPTPNFLIPSWEEHMSLEELNGLLRHCYTRFYLRPKVILRQILCLKNLTMFKTQFKGFLLMLVPLFIQIFDYFKPKKVMKNT